MSHIPQRKEKDCLNCGTIVQGRYCHVCGQENVVPKESIWHMVTHFFYDITHFDSNFFHTVHHLLLKPGFLSKEYTAGRRASYLHPIRMYVFTSAIFFLLFFSFFAPMKNIKSSVDNPLTLTDRTQYIEQVEQSIKKDTGNKQLKDELARLKDTNLVRIQKDILGMKGIKFNHISFTGREYASREEYDSLEKLLPVSEKDGWFLRRLIRKEIVLNESIRENPDETLKKFLESLLHRLPYMLFLSLPLFALILKLVYIRRKQFYFSDHGVFTIHLYVFSFLLLMVVFGIGKLQAYTGWSDLDWVTILLLLLLFFYLYKAMRNFYGQRRAKTFIKFLMVALLSLIMMSILFLLFLFFSAVTI